MPQDKTFRLHSSLAHSFALFVLAAAAPAAAADALGPDEAVRIGVAAHPSVAVATAELEAAQARRAGVERLPLPTITVFGGAQYDEIRGSGTAAAGDTTSQRFDDEGLRGVASLTIEQPLLDPARPAVASSRAAAAEASAFALESRRLDRSLEVRSSFHRRLHAEAQLRAEEAFVEGLEAARKRYRRRASDRRHLDTALTAARAARAQARAQLARARADFTEAVADEAAAGRRLLTEIPFRATELSLGEAVERALRLRPEVQQIEELGRSAADDLRAARRRSWPRLDLVGSAGWQESIGSGALDRVATLSGGIRAQVATDSWFRESAAALEAKAREREMEARAREIRGVIRRETVSAYTQYFASIEALRDLRGAAVVRERDAASWLRGAEANRDAALRRATALRDAYLAEAQLERQVVELAPSARPSEF